MYKDLNVIPDHMNDPSVKFSSIYPETILQARVEVCWSWLPT